MKTLLTITTIIVFFVMLIYFIKSYYYYYRSYDNIGPFPDSKSFKRYLRILNTDISLLTPKSFKMLTIAYTLLLIGAGLLCVLLCKY